jgi:hypothetical protein
LKHRTYRNSILQDLAPEHYQPSLRILTSLLQEERFFARMELYDPQLYTYTPLTRMVDAVSPESYTAYLFDKKVDHWLTTREPGLEDELTGLLEAWSENHEKLAPAFENSVSLSDIEPHSIHLSSLSKLGLEAIHDPASLQGREQELESLFKAAGASYGGCMLPLSASVQKLVSSAFGN